MCKRSEIQIYTAFELDPFKTVVMDSIVFVYSSIYSHYIVNLWHFEKRENMLVFCITTTWKPIEANTQISNFNKPIKLIKFRCRCCSSKTNANTPHQDDENETIDDSFIMNNNQVDMEQKQKRVSKRTRKVLICTVKYAHETAWPARDRQEWENRNAVHGHGWLTHEEQTKWTMHTTKWTTHKFIVI